MRTLWAANAAPGQASDRAPPARASWPNSRRVNCERCLGHLGVSSHVTVGAPSRGTHPGYAPRAPGISGCHPGPGRGAGLQVSVAARCDTRAGRRSWRSGDTGLAFRRPPCHTEWIGAPPAEPPRIACLTTPSTQTRRRPPRRRPRSPRDLGVRRGAARRARRARNLDRVHRPRHRAARLRDARLPRRPDLGHPGPRVPPHHADPVGRPADGPRRR